MNNNSEYFVIQVRNPKQMLIYDLPDPSLQDSWTFGKRFSVPVSEPIIAVPIDEYEDAELLDFFDYPPIMSNRFYETLIRAGVDNMDAYEVVIQSKDKKYEYHGFKAVNIIGIVSAVDREKTIPAEGSSLRRFDSSIIHLGIDPAKTNGLLMFRLAEKHSAIIVHNRVKEIIENEGFPHIVFVDPIDYIGL